LTEIAADLLERRELSRGLDAFGRHTQAERMTEMDDCLHDHRLTGLGDETVHK
jgi:hypothetical protein